jgi:hypothetical protein
LWYWGDTGCGKSHAARSYFRERGIEFWISGVTLRWFDGYILQKGVIFDDLRYEDLSFSWLLRLLDKSPLRVEIKGSSVEWCPTTIIITCPFAPGAFAGFYPRENPQQLLRRLTQVVRFEQIYVD